MRLKMDQNRILLSAMVFTFLIQECIHENSNCKTLYRKTISFNVSKYFVLLSTLLRNIKCLKWGETGDLASRILTSISKLFSVIKHTFAQYLFLDFFAKYQNINRNI
jgi:hypothetical protein